VSTEDPQVSQVPGVIFSYPQKLGDVGLQDSFKVLDLIFQLVILLQDVLDTLKDKLLFAHCNGPKNGRLPVESLLLDWVIDVYRVFCPTVDEDKGEGGIDMEFLAEFRDHPIFEPLLIVAVCWCDSASSEKYWRIYSTIVDSQMDNIWITINAQRIDCNLAI